MKVEEDTLTLLKFQELKSDKNRLLKAIKLLMQNKLEIEKTLKAINQ